MNKSIVADAVGLAVGSDVSEVEAPKWSEAQIDLLQGSAELICDAAGDTAKALDQIKEVFAAAFKAGVLTFALWEDGRKRYEAAYVLRCDKQSKPPANPTESANASWNQTVVPFLKMYQLVKPKAATKDSERMAEKRAKAEAEAMAIADGRSLPELREVQLAYYKTATAESIAQAKSLDKAIEFLEKETKKAGSDRLKVLKESFRKLAQEVAKSDDEAVLTDAIVALKKYIKSAK